MRETNGETNGTDSLYVSAYRYGARPNHRLVLAYLAVLAVCTLGMIGLFASKDWSETVARSADDSSIRASVQR
jgi:hypothetical protein